MAAISERQALEIAARFQEDERLANLSGEAGEALAHFIASAGEDAAAFFTPSVFKTNVVILSRWCMEHLPYNLQSCTTSGAWQISFRQNRSFLTRDDSYLSARVAKDIYIKLYDSLSSAKVRALAEGRLKDFNDWTGVGKLTMEQEKWLSQIGGAPRFRELYEELAK